MKDLKNRDRQVVWHPFTQAKTEKDPLEIVRAKGVTLTDTNGKNYLDVNSSWWVNVHGHGNEVIGNAISEQFSELDHVIFAGVTHPKAVELAEKVIDILPKGFSKVFFSDDGSTSVEVALKMAFQFWFNKSQPRMKILAMEGAYHGDTFGAMSVGQRGYFFEPFEHLFFDVDYLPFPEKGTEMEFLECAKEKLQSESYAALIVEPLVQGSAGMKMYEASVLEELMTMAREKDVLIIFDEVMTGWGRTGKLFAMEHVSLVPDIVCLSKGLTGGVLPLGLTVATERIFEAFLWDEKSKALLHGHSYTGNALSCAAAVASIGIMKSEDTIQNIKRIEEKFHQFGQILQANSKVKEVRHLGAILAIEINVGSEGYFSDVRDKMYHFMISKGILMRPLGNVIFLNPPYCISDEELDYTFEAIQEMLKSVID